MAIEWEKPKPKEQISWGIFLRKNIGFTGTHRSPLVQCDTKETAEKIMHNVEFIHYDPKYKNKDCVIKKMTQWK